MLLWEWTILLAIHTSNVWPRPPGKGGRELAAFVTAPFPCYGSHSTVTKHGSGGEIMRGIT